MNINDFHVSLEDLGSSENLSKRSLNVCKDEV